MSAKASMRLGIRDRKAPVFAWPATVLDDGSGRWCALDDVLTLAGVPPNGADVRGRRPLVAPAVALVTSFDRRRLAKLRNATATLVPDGEVGDGLKKPIDDGAKAIIIGARQPLCRTGRLDRGRRITGFMKFPTAFANPGATIRLPSAGGTFDVDVALAAVIGRPALRVPPAEAMACVAGYTLILDVTERGAFDEEARTNNGLLAKNFAGMSTVGPAIWLVPGRAPPAALEITLSVNGAPRQRFAVADLAHGFARAISTWSLMTLVPGDIVALGATVAQAKHGNLVESPVPIEAGDVVEAAADPIGTLAASFVAPSG